jgi:FkbM family methyltransferase
MWALKNTLRRWASAALGVFPDTLLMSASGNEMWSRMMALHRENFLPRQIIDVGAYTGEWSRRVAAIFPEAHILMIEAQEGKATALAKTCASLRGQAAYKTALLSAQSGQFVKFYEMETGSSIFPELSGVDRAVVCRETETLDSILLRENIKSVDLLKLDVQGAELEVLRGGLETLAQTDVVLLELSVSQYNKGAPLSSDVISFMRECGFHLSDICDVKRIPRGNRVLQFDAFFAKKGSQFLSA